MQSGSGGTTPTEKWADKVTVTASDPEREKKCREVLMGPLPDMYRIMELDKTRDELALIEQAIEAMNRFRKVMCGLSPVSFSPERVHITTQPEMRARLGSYEGKAMLGHIYLYRGLQPQEFLACLTHEMMHATSFLSLHFDENPTRGEDGRMRPKLALRQVGMLLADPVHGLNLPHFHGLNEGVTETAAISIRRLLASTCGILDVAQKHDLKGIFSYPEYLLLLDKLLMVAAGPDGTPIETGQALFRDYFNGTDDFLRMLESHLPGATDILRGTGARPEEVLRGAERLGLSDIADRIRRMIELMKR